ncbi:MAG: metalloregulator ArsR/SmtB family transcription factor [Gemmatimonadota bacterium]|nr:metalloregulator ArsR/SmtB family transcription factor [Gammaproteobacteria bacterium]MDE2784425.1 metalloregulator ArsR/SmtB family transcription factor [Gemmatimonadota bacterium]
MGVTRTRATDFALEAVRTAGWGRALAHPARVAILILLAERRTCVCGEIVDDLPLAQSTVSQHLRVLREEGLVRGEVDGTRSCYCIDADRVRAMMTDLNRLGASLERKAACGC